MLTPQVPISLAPWLRCNPTRAAARRTRPVAPLASLHIDAHRPDGVPRRMSTRCRHAVVTQMPSLHARTQQVLRWCFTVSLLLTRHVGAADDEFTRDRDDVGFNRSSGGGGGGGGGAPASVAVVFVTSQDAQELTGCRRGLVDALRESIEGKPGYRLKMMHGGEQVVGQTEDGIDLVKKPALPARLNCGCQKGNGG